MVQNGQPPTLGPNDRLTVIFYADQGVFPPGLMLMTDVSPDGTFEIKSADEDGIPPGKYRIAITQMVVEGNAKGQDKLRGAFGPASTPFIREFTSNTDDLTLDIGKPAK